MKVYKKLFQYVSDYTIIGYLSMIISSVSAFVMVFSYYFIYKLLREIIINDNYENASYFATIIVVLLTSSALLYLISGIVSHKFAFRLETNLRKRGIV